MTISSLSRIHRSIKAASWSPGTVAHLSMETSTPSARRRSASLRTHSRWGSSSQEYEMNADFMILLTPEFADGADTASYVCVPGVAVQPVAAQGLRHPTHR